MHNSLRSAVEGRDASVIDADDERQGSDGWFEVDADPTVRALANGAVGGLVGTVAMTAYRLPLFEGLPPTAEFWAKYVGDGDPSSYPIQALALHLGYGAAAGSVLGLALSRLGGDADEHDDASERDDRVTLLAGVAYALVLSAFGSRVLLEGLLDVDLASDERLVFHVGHVVYGLALGTWLGTAGDIGRSRTDA